MRKIAPVLVVAVSLAVASSAFSQSTAKTLNGSVGPGFTISLKQGTKKVKSLKAGTYKFKINDKSSSHNFALKGPKVNKDLTGIGFVGHKTVKVTLHKGTYTFYCVPHASIMTGTFKVK